MSGDHLKSRTSRTERTLLITCGAQARPTMSRTAKETTYGMAKAPAGFQGMTRFGLTPYMTSLTYVNPPAFQVMSGAMMQTPTKRMLDWTTPAHATAYRPPMVVYAVTTSVAITRASQSVMSKMAISTIAIAVYWPTR